MPDLRLSVFIFGFVGLRARLALGHLRILFLIEDDSSSRRGTVG